MLACVRASGLKLTPQRMAIVRELAADPTHPTAQELFERLRPALPTMSFATVYNTLDALANAGLCAALSLAPGAARFDPNMRPHHHAVCDRCGLVRDIPVTPVTFGGAETPPNPLVTLGGAETPPNPPGAAPEALGSEGSAVEGAAGFVVRSVERIYRGLCAACAKVDAGARASGRSPRARDQ